MLVFLEDEYIVHEARKHKILIWIELLFIISLKIVPLFFLALLPFLPFKIPIEGNVAVFSTFIYVCWLNMLWVILFYKWTDYYLDVWIVTNKRLIAVTQHGFFSREVHSLELSKIQNVTVLINGVIANMCDFGEITLDTASEFQRFSMKGVARPNEVKDILLGAKHQHGGGAQL